MYVLIEIKHDRKKEKHMTQEEKAKAYDEALERARKIKDGKGEWRYSDLAEITPALTEIFPQLAESEEERIRKDIINLIYWLKGNPSLCSQYYKDRYDSILAWLERQKEEEGYEAIPVESTLEYKLGFKAGKESEKQKEQPLRDFIDNFPYSDEKEQKYVPKFKVGDKLVSTKNFHLTYEILEVGHVNELGNIEYKVEIFTDGKSDNPSNVKYMECCKVDGWGKLIEQKPNYCHYGGDPNIERCKYCSAACIGRLTEEQKPVEIHNPTDEEIESWRKELIEFKKFATKQAKENQLHISYTRDVMWENFCSELLSFVNSRKPVEWNEEDEKMLKKVMSICELSNDKEAIWNWLCSKVRDKSIRPKPKQEWSEEDEEIFNNIIEKAKGGHWIEINEIAWLIDHFKSLRTQPKVELTLLDENIIRAAVAFVEQNDHFNCWGGIDKHTVIKALRSIKPHWKPSEVQKDSLERAIYILREAGYFVEVDCLEPLLEQLKKLM